MVAAAKADLRERVAAGGFREDLFFRLAGVEIEIPPLRDRGDDILLLFGRFAGAAADRLGLARRDPSPAEVAALMGHAWPGNVRELKAAAERFAMGLSGVGAGDILNPAADTGGGLAERVAAYERALIWRRARGPRVGPAALQTSTCRGGA